MLPLELYMDYKNTINLPKTSFPMKADLPKREPLLYEDWEKNGLYDKIQQSRASSPAFILHDGPPYANGDIHIGHALNKILKDIVLRYKTMRGYRVPYVPGWDCHGLPVELQCIKELGKTKHNVDLIEFREKAREFAMRFIRLQREQFKRLGILGEWENPYLTMNYEYQATIVECFWKLYKEGFIFKGLKPIHWCPSCETALAEAEVEYEDKTSPSIYVKFPLTEASAEKAGFPEGTSVLIWTTTPWTLPANVAIALHPEADYSLVKTNDGYLILASQLSEQVKNLVGWTAFEAIKTLKSKSLEKLEYQHPFMDRRSPLILGEHVTMDTGTGCVHTAPGHGQEDYQIGLVYGLPILSPVNARGVFTDEVKLFENQFVFKANEPICNLLKEKGYLVFKNQIQHSYPHCWRCKNPIIFRATQQWFLGVDRFDLRKKALNAIEKVQWIPGAGKNRISSMVESRPDWCLSRQRLWGVAIPVFYCEKCDTEFLDEETAKKVIAAIQKEGASAWFKLSAEEFLPDGKKCSKCAHTEFKKETDIMDVWFDSGVSHHAVLKKSKHLAYPADLYLEGSDQHRGWFQTSLLAGMGLCSQAPYKAVLTHGFVVDGEGKKMSKSTGNVIAPQTVMKEYGADILRLWVASTDYQQDVRISKEILSQNADTYRKIRNTFRYLLGNLFDYDISMTVELKNIQEIDRWILSKLYHLHEKVTDAYERYDFCEIFHLIDHFCTIELSSFYFDILKDRLYTSSANSIQRRSAQHVLHQVLTVLDGILAPIMPFTAEEVWRTDFYLGKEGTSVHQSLWPQVSESWKNEDLEAKWEIVKDIRSEVLRVLEQFRKDKVIGSALEARVELWTDDEAILKTLISLETQLRFIFIVSESVIQKQSEAWPEKAVRAEKIKGLGVLVETARGDKCQRCWNYSSSVGQDPDHPLICDRCKQSVLEVLTSLR